MRYGIMVPFDHPDRHKWDVVDCSDDPGYTVQSQREEADINVIMKRFGVTGNVPEVAMPPTFGDFDGVSDYREAIDLIRAADSSFMSMPAELRARFGNDPAKFLEYVHDPARKAVDLVELGIANDVVVARVKAEQDAETQRLADEAERRAALDDVVSSRKKAAGEGRGSSATRSGG